MRTKLIALVLLSSSIAVAKPQIALEQWTNSSQKTASQLNGLSRSKLGKVALWRDSSLRSRANVADVSLVARHLEAKSRLNGENAYLPLGTNKAVVMTRTGQIVSYLGHEKLKPKDVTHLQAMDIVSQIHTAADDIRAGKNVAAHGYLKSNPLEK